MRDSILSIEGMWDSYCEAVYPEGMVPLQRVETRKAFFAGAAAMLAATTLLANTLDEGPATLFLDAFMEEIKAFGNLT